MRQKKSIVINLDYLERTGHYKDAELIHYEELDYLQKEIRTKVAENAQSENKEILHHPCFFINGGRGSGKTTLLQALQRTLCDSSAGRPRIACLAEFDPTRLSDGENFFVHLLGHVHKILDKYLKDKSILNPEEQIHYKQAYKCIAKITNGLSVLLRRPEFLGNVADASYFVQESVEGGINCTSLHDDFARLMEELCLLLKLDALLVTVDDADMNFNKCSEVFETVRKHLLNCRIVYVFAGDLKLYTMVIRGMQMQHFGKLSLSYDRNRKKQREQLMDNLEEQYMLKLFPLNNRVSLLSFGSVLEKNPYLYDSMSTDKLRGVREYLKHNLRQYASDAALDQIERFMSILSMRSALQLLDYCRKNANDDKGSENYFDYWCDGVQKVTSHALIKHNVDYNSIKEHGARKLFHVIREHAMRLNCGMDGASLRPGLGRDSFQLISFYLSTEFIGKVCNFEGVFSYILNVFPRLQTEIEQKEALSSAIWPEIKGIRHLGALCATSMLPLWWQDATKIKMFANGSIPLFLDDLEFSDEHVKRSSVKSFVDSMTGIMLNQPSIDNVLYFVAVKHALNRVMESKQNFYCMSVYNLVAFIVRLLQLHSDDLQKQEDEIQGILFSMDKMMFTARNLSYREPVNDKEKTLDLSTSFKNGILALSESCKKSVVEQVIKWINKFADKRVRITADALSNCWNDYIDECYLATKNAVVQGYSTTSFVQAGNLFSQYMKIFEDKFSIKVGESEKLLLSDCLNDCPLWKILRDSAAKVDEMHRLCNELNIGPIVVKANLRTIIYGYRTRLGNKLNRLEERLRERFHDVVRLVLNELPDIWRKMEAQAMNIYKLEVPDVLTKKSKNTYSEEKRHEELEKLIKRLMRKFLQNESAFKEKLWERIEKLREELKKKYHENLVAEALRIERRIRAEVRRVENEKDIRMYVEQIAMRLEHYGLRDVNEYADRLETDCRGAIVEWEGEIDAFVRNQIQELLSKITVPKKKNTAKKK